MIYFSGAECSVLVQTSSGSAFHGWVFAILSDIHRAAPHIRINLGSQNIHVIRHIIPCIHNARNCDLFHHHCTVVLPAGERGSHVVVELFV